MGMAAVKCASCITAKEDLWKGSISHSFSNKCHFALSTLLKNETLL